ncbi:DNA-3-methyladenine glycosylase 2 family protein, partial [Streptomyces sp. SID2131]|nr:DNA-3-methyladenine glycosylase 2 family protein [Streptomyces sp. SID2131]
ALLAVPGVTPGAAALIRMRALGDPDVALPEDPPGEEWRPWRSYAVRYLTAPATPGPRSG